MSGQQEDYDELELYGDDCEGQRDQGSNQQSPPHSGADNGADNSADHGAGSEMQQNHEDYRSGPSGVKQEDENAQYDASNESHNDNPTGGSHDPYATDGILVSNLNWWDTDDEVRGWAYEACGRGQVLDMSQVNFGEKDLGFSEHKVNGKAKGEVYVKLKSVQGAQVTKDYINSFPDNVPGHKKPLAIFCPNNPFGRYSKDDSQRGSYRDGATGARGGSGNFNSRGAYQNSNMQRGGFNTRGGGAMGVRNSPNFQPNFNPQLGSLQPMMNFNSGPGMRGGSMGMGMRGRGGMNSGVGGFQTRFPGGQPNPGMGRGGNRVMNMGGPMNGMPMMGGNMGGAMGAGMMAGAMGAGMGGGMGGMGGMNGIGGGMGGGMNGGLSRGGFGGNMGFGSNMGYARPNLTPDMFQSGGGSYPVDNSWSQNPHGTKRQRGNFD